MTRQTSAPLTRLPMNTSNRQARWMVHQVQSGDLDINPAYQRGDVWTEDQRVGLMWSLLSGVPIPTLIINDRGGTWWNDPDAYDPDRDGGKGSYAVVDGKQRLLTLCAWYGGTLAIPASWVDADLIEDTAETNDGLYVRHTGLTDMGKRVVGERILLPIGEAAVSSLREEAAIYLLVNGAGTPQTEADMDNATRIAEGK